MILYTYMCDYCHVKSQAANRLDGCLSSLCPVSQNYVRPKPGESLGDSLGGIKADDGKEPIDLISPVALFEVAKVLQFGSKKYASWNWSKGIAYTRILAGIMRHVLKYMSGEDKDPETGLSHIAHAMCGCMFILHYEKYRASFDDREKEAYKTL